MIDPALHSVRRALGFIEERLGQPVTIDEIARAAGYSAWHFQRLFLALVHEPVATYLRRRRLTEAARLLRQSPPRRLLDVALAAGFESHEAFTRAFRRASGLTPSAFRNDPEPSLGWMRLPLLPESLHLLPKNMQLEPTIVELPVITLAGLSARYIAAMSPDATNMKVIPPLWHAFGQRREDLAPLATNAAIAYGATRFLLPSERSREDELEYLAGFEVAPGATLPAGIVGWTVPANRYARFTHRGPIQAFSATLNYVFGSWFPRSAYEPAFTVELELYDERFKFDAPDSELDYFVPIKPRP